MSNIKERASAGTENPSNTDTDNIPTANYTSSSDRSTRTHSTQIRIRTLEQYLDAGFSITPVLPRSKAAFFQDWANRDELGRAELMALYTGTDYNFGIRLGAPSGGLIDVDLDCVEAVAIAALFLPETDATFGRAGKQDSHWLYRCDLQDTHKFIFKFKEKDDDGKERTKTDMLLEVRSNKAQTVGPGSIHQDTGEPITWRNGTLPEPAEVDAEEIVKTAAMIAVSSLLGRYYPSKGARHDFELGLASGLLRLGLGIEDVGFIMDGMAVAAGLKADHDGYGKARDTQKKLEAGNNAWGWPMVIDGLGGDDKAKRIVNHVINWLSEDVPAVRLDKDHFLAYLPTHKYIFRPTGMLWDAAGVSSNLGSIAHGFDSDSNEIRWKAAAWLDAYRPVHQITWLPGAPEIIEDVLIDEHGMRPEKGTRSFNRYRPPLEMPGDASLAGPWIDHIKKIYPEDAEHILDWCAHRVQTPGDKVNHALVLGGAPGIGKDTLLEPLVQAVGPGNFADVSPSNLVERFNEFLESVVLRVSEARDSGDGIDRYSLYERSKIIIAAPPATHRIDRKYIGSYRIPNVTGVIFTTNNQLNGLYFEGDDRRHYVAWSESKPGDFTEEYFTSLFKWYTDEGGYGHVRAFLLERDLSNFNPKAPPKKTAAFWRMVRANRTPEDDALADVIDALGTTVEDGDSVTVKKPAILTFANIVTKANELSGFKYGETTVADLTDPHAKLATFLQTNAAPKRLPFMLNKLEYTPVDNQAAKDGRWKIGKGKHVVYGRMDMTESQRLTAINAAQRKTASTMSVPILASLQE